MLFEPEFWVAVAFVILMILFAYLGIHKTVLTALDHRAERIKGELDDARRIREEAAKLLADYKARQAGAERAAEEIISNAKVDAERIAADAKARMEVFVARRTKIVEGKIALAEAQALADIRATAADTAVAAASIILSQLVKGQIADELLAKGIAEVRGMITSEIKSIVNWADTLPVSERAPAIAALGVATSVFSTSGADMSSPEQIARAFKVKMDQAKHPNRISPRRLVWRRSHSDDWESIKQRLSPKIAAEAWNLFVTANGPVELQINFPDPEGAGAFTELVPWLSELFWTQDARVRSLFLHKQDLGSRRSWHWPLRLGFLPDRSSQDLMAEFATNDHEWSITLTRSIDVARTGQGCDMLLSPLDAAETKALVEGHRIRATTIVLLDRKPFATVEHARAVLALKAAARAAAIASVSNSRIVDTIVEIIRALSHNEPFDWAISQAARNGGGVPLTVADQKFIYHSHIGAVGDLWAARLDARYSGGHSVGGQPNLATEIRAINRGDFFFEHSDASRLAQKINEALTGADPPPRYLGVTVQRVERADEAEIPKLSASALVHNQWRLLVVNIAPRIDRQEFPAFPGARIDWEQDQQTLSIVLTAPNCDLLPISKWDLEERRRYGSQSGEIVSGHPESELEDDGRPRDSASTGVTIYSIGPSSDALFLIRPRAAGSLKARILVVHSNRILQTAILNAEVASEDPNQISRAAGKIDDERGGSEEPIRLVAEGMIRSDMQDLGERSAFDLTILTNDSLTGAPQGTFIANDQVFLQDFGEIKPIAERIGTRLKEMVEAPNDFRDAGSEPLVALLRTLATDGVLISRSLRDAGLGPILDSNPHRIQVVAAKPDEVLPVEFIYDGNAPDLKTAKICPNQARALDEGSCGSCPNRGSSTHVCAVRFWGLRKVIERHIFGKKRPGSEGKYEVTAKAPSLERDRIKRPVTRLFASSHRAANFTGGPVALREIVQRLKRSTNPVGKALSVGTWTQWRAFVRRNPPSLCVLLPHTDVDNGNDVIEIGAKDFLTNAQIDEDVVGINHPVIVILLGCETARPELRFASFVASFRHAGADVVIGTLTPILGRHAAPVANALIEQLDQLWDSGSRVTTIGDALKDVRRTFMSKGLPIGLTLVAFGDADWLIGE